MWMEVRLGSSRLFVGKLRFYGKWVLGRYSNGLRAKKLSKQDQTGLDRSARSTLDF